jgi:hypothetical protein
MDRLGGRYAKESPHEIGERAEEAVPRRLRVDALGLVDDEGPALPPDQVLWREGGRGLLGWVRPVQLDELALPNGTRGHAGPRAVEEEPSKVQNPSNGAAPEARQGGGRLIEAMAVLRCGDAGALTSDQREFLSKVTFLADF